MGRKIAGSRRPAREDMTDGAMVVVALVPGPQGVEVRMENRAGFDKDDIAVAMRAAADQLQGKDDRAKGMW